jgi:hypothetical protein
MSREDERRRIAVEVTRAEPSENSLQATRQYRAWCEVNALDVFPESGSAEQQLLRFLHSSVETHEWAWSTCNMYALGIAQSFVRGGHPDPRGRRIKAWLLARKRDLAGRQVMPRPDAMAGDQIRATAERAAGPVANPQITRLRGIVAVADTLGVDPTCYHVAVQRLRRSAFTIRSEDIVITDMRGERHVLDQALRPEMFAALTLALSGSDADLPLNDATQPAKAFKKRDTVWLRRAWDLAAPRGGARVSGNVANWNAAFAAGSPDDRTWWLKCVDPGFETRAQGVAYLLFGVDTAFRHATMKRLTLAQMRVSPTGFSLDVDPQQHKGGRQSSSQGGEARTLTKYINHLGPDARDCPVFCPACALYKHLEIRRRRGGVNGDPVWVNRFGNQLELTRANERLRQVLARLDRAGDRPQTIGTRSLRVTAATLARQSGMSLTEIADDVTNHVKLSTLGLYLRQVDPFSVDLTLPLDVG